MDNIKAYLTNVNRSLRANTPLLVLILLLSSITLLLEIENPMTVELIAAFIFISIVRIFLTRGLYPIFLLQVLLAFLLLLEVYAARKLKVSNQISSFHEKDYVEKVNGMGYFLLPNVEGAREVKLFEKDTLFDVRYSTDSFRRRIPEDRSTYDRGRERHAILLGCSFTFGYGLDYGNTMSAILEEMDTSYSAYNYGFSGLAPHQLALMFEPGIDIINRKSVPQEKGFMLYTYIGDHLDRVYGSSNFLAWGFESPDVSVVDGRLEVAERNRAKVALSHLMTRSKTLSLFRVGFNYPRKEAFYRRFAGLINYMSARYHSQHPGNPFLVGLYPENWGPRHKETYDLGWVPFLDSTVHLVRVPDPPDFEVMNPKYWIPHDGHPTRTLNSHYLRHVMDAVHRIQLGEHPENGQDAVK